MVPKHVRGSTGEPVRFIQDWEYAARSGAITLVYAKLAGREIGESEVRLWGSERDIIYGSEGRSLIRALGRRLLYQLSRLILPFMGAVVSLLDCSG